MEPVYSQEEEAPARDLWLSWGDMISFILEDIATLNEEQLELLKFAANHLATEEEDILVKNLWELLVAHCDRHLQPENLSLTSIGKWPPIRWFCGWLSAVRLKVSASRVTIVTSYNDKEADLAASRL